MKIEGIKVQIDETIDGTIEVTAYNSNFEYIVDIQSGDELNYDDFKVAVLNFFDVVDSYRKNI